MQFSLGLQLGRESPGGELVHPEVRLARHTEPIGPDLRQLGLDWAGGTDVLRIYFDLCGGKQSLGSQGFGGGTRAARACTEAAGAKARICMASGSIHRSSFR